MTGRRTISPEALREILAEHERWLASEGKEGRRANLHKCELKAASLMEAILRHADLSNANLENANLERARLAGANMTAANLRGTTLSEADLQGANLSKAQFYDADLTNADLREVRGLTADHLAGTDLTGAELPPQVAQFTGLAYVAEVSRNARTTFFTLLLVCAYSVLTILTTTDHRLVTDTASSPIPFTGTEAPIVWIYRLLPLLIVCIYTYLLLYLGRLWRCLPRLPAIFPDGTPLTRTVYPWLLNDLIRDYMPKLQSPKRPLYNVDKLLSITLAWLVPPLTILLFWWRSLPRQSATDTFWHVMLLTAALVIGTLLFRLAILTINHKGIPFFGHSQREIKPLLNLIRARRYSLSLGSIVMLVLFISVGTLYGGSDRTNGCAQSNPAVCWTKAAVPELLSSVGYRAYADLQFQEISRRPNLWTGSKSLEAVVGANLAGQSLRYADAERAFFAKAVLRSADLEKADLQGADLRQAKLINANLERAHLEDADLSDAALVGATLEGAYLDRAKLQGANLRGADLTNANLGDARLVGADLRGVILAGAKGLTRAQLTTACGDENTVIPRALWHYTLDPCKN